MSRDQDSRDQASRDQDTRSARGRERQDRREEQAPKRPSFIAYHVREGEDQKAYFNRIGAAFAHKDGQGHDILLDSTPVDGRVTIRTPQERSGEDRNDNREAPRQTDRGPRYER